MDIQRDGRQVRALDRARASRRTGRCSRAGLTTWGFIEMATRPAAAHPGRGPRRVRAVHPLTTPWTGRRRQLTTATTRAHWTAVEEATELLHEERFREALVELRGVLESRSEQPVRVLLPRRRVLRGRRDRGSPRRVRGVPQARADAPGCARRPEPRAAHPRRRPRRHPRGAWPRCRATPGDPDALHAVGLAYHARGDDAAARKYLEAYLATHPEFEVEVETRALLGSAARRRPRQDRGRRRQLDSYCPHCSKRKSASPSHWRSS